MARYYRRYYNRRNICYTTYLVVTQFIFTLFVELKYPYEYHQTTSCLCSSFSSIVVVTLPCTHKHFNIPLITLVSSIFLHPFIIPTNSLIAISAQPQTSSLTTLFPIAAMPQHLINHIALMCMTSSSKLIHSFYEVISTDI